MVADQGPQNLEEQTLVVVLHSQPVKEEAVQVILEAVLPEKSEEVRVDLLGEEGRCGN